MRSVDVQGATLLVQAIQSDWACMTPEARQYFVQELMALATDVVKVHRAAVLRADFEAWHLRRKDDADYIAATDKGRAWLAISELTAGAGESAAPEAPQDAGGPGEADCTVCNGRGFYGSPGARCEFCKGKRKVRFWRPAPETSEAGGPQG